MPLREKTYIRDGFVSAGNAEVTGSLGVSGTITGNLTGNVTGNASTATSASFTSTASFVNTLNQNVLITGSLTVGATSAGATENTLTLGPRSGTGEGGQLLLQAQGGTYTSASMWDNYQNSTRLLRGTNAGSDALVATWNMHNKQMALPSYNSTSAFTGTVVGLLAFDSSGNILTTTASSGGGGSVTINNNTDNYIITATGTANTLNGESNLQFDGSSLLITGSITASGAVIAQANGQMYFRGGDDAEFWDINVANTVGIYGQQNSAVGSIKLGSAGGTISGKAGNIGIGTANPGSTLEVSGNITATSLTGSVTGSFTGSLRGTASYATQALSSSFATTSSYILNAVSSSFASTASYVNPLVQNVQITGSVTHSGSLFEVASNGGNFRVGKNGVQLTRTDNAAVYGTLTYTPNDTVDSDKTVRASAGAFGNTSYQYPNVGLTLGYYTTKWSAQGGGTGATQVFELSCVDASNTTNFFLLKNGSTQLLVASSSGDLLIGTGNTNGAYKLDVSGSGNFRNNLTITGSLLVSGSSVVTGSLKVTAGVTGSLQGTASYASQALTSSYALTASYALSSNGGGGGSTFPYTGSAQITGSLGVTGSIYSNNTVGSSYAGYFKNNSYNVGGSAPLIIDDGNAGGGFAIGYGGSTSAYMYFPPYFGNNSIYLHGSGYYGVFFEGLSSYDGVTAFVAPGRVKIGNNTLPSSKLHVVGAGSTSATTTFLVQNSSLTTILEIKDDQSIGFFGATTVTQPTTTGASSTYVNNPGTALNDADTYDGYTIAQVVKALRKLGLLA